LVQFLAERGKGANSMGGTQGCERDSILKHGLDQQPLEQELPLHSPDHINVRGREYYH
jgi:hypothetical protein